MGQQPGPQHDIETAPADGGTGRTARCRRSRRPSRRRACASRTRGKIGVCGACLALRIMAQATQQLDQALANERQQLNNQGAGGALASLLDQNGDGKLDMNDLVKLGSSLLGGKR